MKTTMMKKAVCLLAAMVLAGAFPVAKAYADKGDLTLKQMDDGRVNLMLGKAEMITTSGKVADVMVANPSVVDVMAVKANQLYLVGNALGETNIMILDTDGNVLKKMNVHVQMDTAKLETMVHELYPNEAVKVRA